MTDMQERWIHNVESDRLVLGVDEGDRHLSGLAAALLLITLLLIFWGGAYLLGRDFWGTVRFLLGLLALLFVASLCWGWIRKVEHQQRAHIVLSANPKVPYSLLLRSSTADRNLSPPAVYPSGWFPPPISDSPGEVPLRFRFRSFLEQRLRPLEVFAVKNHDKLDTLIGYSYEDRTWDKEIIGDIERARFVLVVPLWLSPGLLLEVDLLVRGGFLHKVLLILPPCFRGEGRSRQLHEMRDHIAALSRSTLAYEALRDEWNRCSAELGKRGIQMPIYPGPDDYLKDPQVLRDVKAAFGSGAPLPQSFTAASDELKRKLMSWQRGAILAQSEPGSGCFDTLAPWDMLDLKIATSMLGRPATSPKPSSSLGKRRR